LIDAYWLYELNFKIRNSEEKNIQNEIIIRDLKEEVRARKADIEVIKNSKTYKLADKMGKVYRKVRNTK
jgi:hypothetical protein